MKKLFNKKIWGNLPLYLLIAAVVAGSNLLFTPNAKAAITSITVTSPNTAVFWSGVHNITWTSDDAGVGNVDIFRCIGGDCGLNQTLIAANEVNDGTYSWNTAGLNETDKIMIRDSIAPFAFDASDVSFTVDNTAPTVAVTMSDYALKAGETATVTYTFSEVPYGLILGDVTTPSGAINSFSTTADPLVYTSTYTPTADTTDLINEISVSTDWYDASGNPPAGASNSANYTVDTLRPSVSIVLTDPTLKAGETSLVTFTFNEAVTGFDNTDMVYIDNGTMTAVSSGDGGTTWTATFTPTADITDASNILSLGVGDWVDARGNAPSAGYSSANYTIDTLRPTVGIVLADTALRVGETSLVTFTFSSAPTDFAAADVTAPSGSIGAVSATADPLVFTATYTPTADTTDSSNLMSVGTSWTDDAGNAPAGTTDSLNYAVDTTRPTVSIVFTDTALKAGETSLVTFTFSEIAADFDNTDLTIVNGTLTSVASGDGITWTATYTPTTDIEDASNVMSAGIAWLDASGNMPSGTTDSANYTIDTLRPTVAVTMSDYAVKNGDTPTVTFTFSSAPTDFAAADVTAPSGSIGAVSATADPLVFTATYTPTADTTDSSNLMSVGTSWTDDAGNAPAGTTDSLNYAVDTLLPTLSIVVSDTALKAGETSLVTFTFSEIAPSAFFDNTDLNVVENGTLSSVSTADGGLTYTATLTPTTDVEDISNIITVGFAWVDASGNMPSGSTNSNNYVVETLAPVLSSVVGTSVDKLGDTIVLNFSEAMNPATITTSAGITSITDSIGGALNLTNDTGAWSAGDTIYTVTLNEGADLDYIRNGATVTVVLAATVTDIAGNSVSTTGIVSGNVAKEAVTPTITVTANSVNAGGDTITITSDEVLSTTATTISNWTVQYDDNGSGLNIQTVTLANAVATINAANTVVTITLDEVTDGASIPSSKFVKVTPHATNIKDLVGNNGVSADYTATGVTTEVTAPTISAVSVADGATSVAVNPTITITLSEALSPATVNGNTIKLYTDVGNNNAVNIGTDTEVAVTISLENNGAATKIYITPNANLSNSGNYIYRISTGVKDLSGNALAANADYDFTTVVAGTGALAVDAPYMIKSTGTADDSYANGWEWVMRVTLPTDKTHFAIKFANWTSGANTLATANNMEYYSEQIAGVGLGTATLPVAITAANTYPADLNITTDADTTRAGIQTDIHVKVKIPASTVAGSYSTTYNASATTAD